AVVNDDAGLGDDGADVDDAPGKCCDRNNAVRLRAADRNTAQSSGDRALVVDIAGEGGDALQENAVKALRGKRAVVLDPAGKDRNVKSFDGAVACRDRAGVRDAPGQGAAEG